MVEFFSHVFPMRDSLRRRHASLVICIVSVSLSKCALDFSSLSVGRCLLLFFLRTVCVFFTSAVGHSSFSALLPIGVWIERRTTNS